MIAIDSEAPRGARLDCGLDGQRASTQPVFLGRALATNEPLAPLAPGQTLTGSSFPGHFRAPACRLRGGAGLPSGPAQVPSVGA